ncbi:hypothetical protein [Oceanicoccus sagamiensis]|uniref:PEP-CTERM protein-sorting domain-containing protein n=1 Tax=Oceanicoccus sagamiensis TaxID=716816 RepID=A0A1X9NIC6_9GAMM|nr:hypothetical protein [Oceanicoccus sagamiensis]ARN76142.1 hypothetical protein BST96_19790 [Oceanicoccus sagamiensis]
MKKLAIALAVSAASVAAQAAVQTTTFTGTLDTRLDASAYVSSTYLVSTGSASVDYSFAVSADNGAFAGAVLTLHGATSTFGAAGIPKGVQQEVTFESAQYTFTTGNASGTSTVIPYTSALANPAFSYNTVEATVSSGIGGPAVNDALVAGAPSVSLTAGSVSCATKAGADCSGDWTLGNIDGLDFLYQVEFTVFEDAFFSDLSLTFVSPSGNTGMGLTGSGNAIDPIPAPSPVPVPAAAWLFGSALVGLAGIGRKRRA